MHQRYGAGSLKDVESWHEWTKGRKQEFPMDGTFDRNTLETLREELEARGRQKLKVDWKPFYYWDVESRERETKTKMGGLKKEVKQIQHRLGKVSTQMPLDVNNGNRSQSKLYPEARSYEINEPEEETPPPYRRNIVYHPQVVPGPVPAERPEQSAAIGSSQQRTGERSDPSEVTSQVGAIGGQEQSQRQEPTQSGQAMQPAATTSSYSPFHNTRSKGRVINANQSNDQCDWLVNNQNLTLSQEGLEQLG
uniref:uncharacterized protein isoform X1 n=1 Tax=Myxine glutinosa TaxID=7769 RepID=UPI003590227E